MAAVALTLAGLRAWWGWDSRGAGRIEPDFEQTRLLMDTVVRIAVYGAGAREAGEAAFGEIQRIESLLSTFLPDSEVSAINRGAGRWVTVSGETVALLERAMAACRESAGAFDVTVGPLMELWGFASRQYRVPGDKQVELTLTAVGGDKLLLDAGANGVGPGRVKLARPGMRLDLGGVAKGYAAARAAEVLRRHGIASALIDAGGNIVVVGARPDGRPWRLGIRHPRKPGDVMGYVEVKDAAVVTSGDYERFFISGGTRYHHILDPRTGYPARNSVASTVVCRDSTVADIVSTAAFVLGGADGLEFAESQGCEALLVTPDGSVVSTGGFPGRHDARVRITRP